MLGFFIGDIQKRNRDVFPFSLSERHIKNLTHMCDLMSNSFD